MATVNRQSDKYVMKCKDIILKHIDLRRYAVFLFGSRARGKHRFAADIDIGILGNVPMPYKEISRLKDMIDESIVPYQVDIVDFYTADKNFKETALSKIQIWNKPEFINLN